MKNMLVIAVACLVAALSVWPVLATPTEDQRELSKVPRLVTSKGAESTDLGAPITSALVPLDGNPTFSLTALSSVASGTVEVHVQFWVKVGNAVPDVAGNYRKLGVADKVTLTAVASTTGNGTETISATTYYPCAEIVDYAARGATHAELRVIGVPSGGGTAALRPWAHAASPRGLP